MKAQRFEIGQPITPNTEDWNGAPGPDPVFGNIYHVMKYYWYRGQWYLGLEEIGFYLYEETGFDPLVESGVLAMELSQIELEVTI